MRGLLAIIAAIASLAAAPADAQDGLEAARALYDVGKWREAGRAAAAEPSADAQSFAAGAYLAALMTEHRPADMAALAEAATAHAREALRLDEDFAEAHLRYAAALNYEARTTAPVTAFFRRLPHRSREHIERALALDPDDAWAHAMYGSWNMEVARRGGARVLGADFELGLSHYRRAVELNGDEPAIPYHFAVLLLAADPQAHRAEARALLERALEGEAGSVFDRRTMAMARSLLQTLEDGGVDAGEEAARRLER